VNSFANRLVNLLMNVFCWLLLCRVTSESDTVAAAISISSPGYGSVDFGCRNIMAVGTMTSKSTRQFRMTANPHAKIMLRTRVGRLKLRAGIFVSQSVAAKALRSNAPYGL
jgi:hypothetical protein